jgi:hypothetical protein
VRWEIESVTDGSRWSETGIKNGERYWLKNDAGVRSNEDVLWQTSISTPEGCTGSSTTRPCRSSAPT